MLRAGERMEFWYGHWFDCTVVNEDVDQAFEEVFFLSSVVYSKLFTWAESVFILLSSF